MSKSTFLAYSAFKVFLLLSSLAFLLIELKALQSRWFPPSVRHSCEIKAWGEDNKLHHPYPINSMSQWIIAVKCCIASSLYAGLKRVYTGNWCVHIPWCITTRLQCNHTCTYEYSSDLNDLLILHLAHTSRRPTRARNRPLNTRS